jgi:hypothetical protein
MHRVNHASQMSASSRVGRWATAAGVVAVAALALVAGNGFEVHDEVVARTKPRAVRLAAVPTDPATAAIEYVEGYDAGARRAAAEDRPMLVIFRAGWCRWSAELAQGPLADRRLVAHSRKFVCVVIDADRHAADCKRFGVKEFPTVLLASSGGTEYRRWTGCPTVEDLVTAMNGETPAGRMAATDEGKATATR